MANLSSADFGIKVDFRRETRDPARIFRVMTALIEAFQGFDKELTQTLDLEIEPFLILEDIQTGSLKALLRTAIESVDDHALASGDMKKVVGTYLVKAKHILIDKLDGKMQLTRKDLKEIQGDFQLAAEETNINRMPFYRALPELNLVKTISNVGTALSHLDLGDSAQLITSEGDSNFNPALSLSPESMQKLITRETLVHSATMILKVKKPDYLGESMWDFKFGDHPIQAKITDRKWLLDFQSRKIDVRPGDAIRANVRQTTGYGYDSEVVDEHYEVVEVIEVIPQKQHAQGRLILED